MKIYGVFRTRDGIVSASGGGSSITRIDGLHYNQEDSKYYDSENNEVELTAGNIYYSDGELYLYNGELSKIGTKYIIETTWQELKDLRDNNNLIPGCKYRITDVTNAFSPDSEYYGKQIDVIVEATSTNTLSEEAQAAMHENIYDVTFSDGVMKKCYIYQTGVDTYNMVDVDTLLGNADIDFTEIDEVNKIATFENPFSDGYLDESNVQYNYFQNINLSSWKIYYCLDNDKARFSWVDDSIDGSNPAKLTNDRGREYIRVPERDTIHNNIQFYAWADSTDSSSAHDMFTQSQTPDVGDDLYGPPEFEAMDTIGSFTPAHQGTELPNGRGVIYEVKTIPDNHLIKVTWIELKDLRDNGKLVAGRMYRITDYQCTTTQANTRSAGHQFDIVLLALSANKLAEEGWAMMNESNVYDVTFGDNETLKCYLYKETEYDWNIVPINNLAMGWVADPSDLSIDETNKTIFYNDAISDEPVGPNLTYNYFQNSNLSAWKVWYCLDNDTDRFEWADDSVDEGSPASVKLSDNNTYIRDTSKDTRVSNKNYYGWTFNNTTYYSRTETNIDGFTKFYRGGGSIMVEIEYYYNTYNPYVQGTGLPNGRGVIYRLIDEWDNDCPYDFKNIQFVRKLTNGEYDASTGTNTYVYTFTAYYDNVCHDFTIDGIALQSDDGSYFITNNNKIGELLPYGTPNERRYKLPNTVFLLKVYPNEEIPAVFNNELRNSNGSTILVNSDESFSNNIILSSTPNDIYTGRSNQIFAGNMKATFENIP